MFLKFAIASLVTASLAQAVAAETFNPEGIYFNQFKNVTPKLTGTPVFLPIPDGMELFQVTPDKQGRPGVYEMSDIMGGGFVAKFDENNKTFTIIEANSPITEGVLNTKPVLSPKTQEALTNAGEFLDPDTFAVRINFGPSDIYEFKSKRIAFSNADFPLKLDSPVVGHSDFSGDWLALERTIDPATGKVLKRSKKSYVIRQEGAQLELTSEHGFAMTGTFETGRQVVVRVLQAFDRTEQTPKRFESFPENTSSEKTHILANIVFTDANHFEALIVEQTVAPLGAEEVSVRRVVAERKIPAKIGDLNGDFEKDFQDLKHINKLVGSDQNNGPYNLLADLNGDGKIDKTDAWSLKLDLVKEYAF